MGGSARFIDRSFSWITRCHRLALDHEATSSSAITYFVLTAAMTPELPPQVAHFDRRAVSTVPAADPRWLKLGVATAIGGAVIGGLAAVRSIGCSDRAQSTRKTQPVEFRRTRHGVSLHELASGPR